MTYACNRVCSTILWHFGKPSVLFYVCAATWSIFLFFFKETVYGKCAVLLVLNGIWRKLIRMQNNYELQKDFVLVVSLARARTTFSPLPQVVVYCVSQLIASKWGR